MVTAELAAAVPVLVLLLTLALGAVALTGQRARVQDAAREAARAAARGDPAVVTARQVAPGVAVTTTLDGDLVVATARLEVELPLLPAVTITERAVAEREPP